MFLGIILPVCLAALKIITDSINDIYTNNMLVLMGCLRIFILYIEVELFIYLIIVYNKLLRKH